MAVPPGTAPPRIAGLILAGGQGRRMGGADKAFLDPGGGPLVGQVLLRLAPQVCCVAISANGDPARFSGYGCAVLADEGPAGEGPLAGVLAGLAWARAAGAGALVTVAVDSPFFPADLVRRLAGAAGRGSGAAFAASAGRAHATFALWPVEAHGRLAEAFAGGMRRLQDAAALLRAVACDFAPAGDGGDPFFNVNTPDDLASAAWRARQRPAPPAPFARVVVAGWSAASVPLRRGTEPIRIGEATAEGGAPPVHVPTRHQAAQVLSARIGGVLDRGERLLLGLDFAFGYPAGFAARLTGRAEAPAVWDWLAEAVTDDASNRNNRFAVADRINRLFPAGSGPFWGRPRLFRSDALAARRVRDLSLSGLAEHRLVECALRSSAAPGRAVGSVWQLCYAGAAGSRALLGLPMLSRLRRKFGAAISVWPFEDRPAPVTLAEIRPALIDSVLRAASGHEARDAAQVDLLARALSRLAATGRIAPLFDLPPSLSAAARTDVVREEGWILGAGHQSAPAGAPEGPAG